MTIKDLFFSEEKLAYIKKHKCFWVHYKTEDSMFYGEVEFKNSKDFEKLYYIKKLTIENINTKLKKTTEKRDLIDEPEEATFILFELPNRNSSFEIRSLSFEIRKEDFEKYKEKFNLK